jgi:transcriptional regulator
MYIPGLFAKDEPEALAALIRERAFATVVTVAGGVPFASHLPLLLDGDVLIGHMARANPQWEHFASGDQVLAIFHGPHAFISPSWYAGGDHVPTWNYAVVHAYGAPRVLDDPAAARDVLARLTAAMDPTGWRIDALPEEKVANLVKAIVAFEIRVTRLEGRWKVGQNRTPADRASAAAHLHAQGGEDATSIAALMNAVLDRPRREP